jgi:hypothetical protein
MSIFRSDVGFLLAGASHIVIIATLLVLLVTGAEFP